MQASPIAWGVKVNHLLRDYSRRVMGDMYLTKAGGNGRDGYAFPPSGQIVNGQEPPVADVIMKPAQQYEHQDGDIINGHAR